MADSEVTRTSMPKVDFEEFKGLISEYGSDKVKQLIKSTGEKNG